MISNHWPVIGICGYSGSGKTTLIEHLVPVLAADGLSVAVVKHDAHGMTLDKAGKDSDRFFRAGASVFAHDPEQGFLRFHNRGDLMLPWALELLLREHDLVLVEGHKQTPLPAKIWLSLDSGEEAPPDACPALARLSRDADRLLIASRIITEWLPEQLCRRPVYAGLLVGGRSSRMGFPKQILAHGAKTWGEHILEAILPHVEKSCLLGGGGVAEALRDYPRLPDVPDTAGPQAGMLAAMRWAPTATWLFVACDMPLLTSEAIGWLLAQRAPGRWAIMPRNPESGQVEPLCAWYDPRLAPALQEVGRAIALSEHPKAFIPVIPPEHISAWRNINTPTALNDMA